MAKSILALVLALGIASPAAAGELFFEYGEVLTSTSVPGGSAVFFSSAREILGYGGALVQRQEMVIDEDLDREVAYTLFAQPGASSPPSFASRAIWGAVDFDSGDLSVAAPPGSELVELDFPPTIEALETHFLDLRWGYVEILLVRPQVGWWTMTLGDGAPLDEDGETNGMLLAAVSGFTPQGESPPAPERFEIGDVVMVVDPNRMVFYAARLEEEAEEGGEL